MVDQWERGKGDSVEVDEISKQTPPSVFRSDASPPCGWYECVNFGAGVNFGVGTVVECWEHKSSSVWFRRRVRVGGRRIVSS